VKLKEATKAISRKFACSTTVDEDATGTEVVHIQADVSEELPAFLAETFSIPSARMFFKEGQRREPVDK
jgi:translation initiation factor 1 (eIF-1/SUI1)